MKRFLPLLLLPLFVQSLHAQTSSALVSEAMRLYEAQSYPEAYELFTKVLANDSLEAQAGRGDTLEMAKHRECWVTSGANAVRTYYKQKTAEGNARCRAISRAIYPYATATTQRSLDESVAVSYQHDAVIALNAVNSGLTIDYLYKARDIYHAIADTVSEVSCLWNIANIAYNYWLDDSVATVCREAQALAQTIPNRTVRYTYLRKLRKLAMKMYNDELTNALTAQIDTMDVEHGDEKMRVQYYMDNGDIAARRQNYPLAISWYRKAEPLALSEKRKDNALSIYFSLQEAYIQTKQYDEALACAVQRKAMIQSQTDRNNREYYVPYTFIANIYRLMGDSVRCFRAMDSLAVSLTVKHDPRTDYIFYTQRAGHYAAFKNHALALADFVRADSVRNLYNGDYDSYTVTVLLLMAIENSGLQRYDEAERLMRRYVETSAKLFPGNETRRRENYLRLADANAYNGHFDEAFVHYTEAVESLRDDLRHRLSYFNSNNREAYWNKALSSFLAMTPFAIKAGATQSEFTRTSYEALMLTKSFLLESEYALRDLINKYGSQQDKQSYKRIEQLHHTIKQWERNPQQHVDSLSAATKRLDVMENQLMRSCSKLGEITKFMTIGYDEVKASLRKNDVLLDFTDYTPRSRGRVYAAYVVKRDYQFPLLRELFAESSLDSLHVTRPQEYYDDAAAEQLLQRLWEPLSSEVKEGATVYYVPSQLLYQVAIESLPLADGTLLGDHYHFVRLSSSRELVRYAARLNLRGEAIKEKKATPTATLYGGLQYDVDPTTMALEASKSNVSPLFAQRGMDEARGDSVYHELPASRLEVEAIARTLTANGFDVNLLTRTAGTEESFLALSDHAPQVLHLATHGFYYTPTAAARVSYLRGYSDAMSLSGLVLSGGNAGWRGRELPKGVLGGVLTASSIARLNFEGTQLAVLSACQTGQGQVTPEGLYGLHRAFKKAGVRSLVMTLWNVSDAATNLFMTTFYDALATNAWDKHRAFRLAQSAVRTAYPEPYYWAAFVMVD